MPLPDLKLATPRPCLGFHCAGLAAILLLIVTSTGRPQTKPSATLADASLEELMNIKVESVYGASKHLQKLTQAPASVTIVTSDEIRKNSYRTLADALRNVRGFYVTYDRNYAYVGARGFNRPGDFSTRILLLVDGHRINDNAYEQAFIGTDFPVDVDLIDRIEVIRGPSSSIYGTNAFFAVVNVITRLGQSLNGAQASAELASYGTFKGRVTYGAKLRNGLDLMLSGTFYSSQGHERLYFPEFDNPVTRNGIARNADDDRLHQFFGNLTYRDFTLRGIYASRDKGIPTASFDTIFGDNRSRTIDARGFMEVQYSHSFEKDRTVMGRVYYDQYDFKGSYVYDLSETTTPLPVVEKDLTYGKWWGGELKFTQSLPQWNQISIGSEFRRNLRQDFLYYDFDPLAPILDVRQNSTLWGLYFQDEVTLRKGLVLNVGVRHDRYPNFGGTTNPRLALIYSPHEKTAFKFLFGEAFRAPSVYEIYYEIDGFKSNPSLKPEKIRTYEVVWEHYIGDRFRLTTSGFHYGVRDLIDQITDNDGDLIFKNSGRVNANGVELEVEKNWAWGLESRVSYTFQDARPQAGDLFSNSPRHLGVARLSAPLARRKLFASFDLQYMSRRKTLSGAFVNAHAVPNFTIFSQDLLKRWKFSVSVYNLFNNRYGDPAGIGFVQDVIEQDGRSFRLKATYRF